MKKEEGIVKPQREISNLPLVHNGHDFLLKRPCRSFSQIQLVPHQDDRNVHSQPSDQREPERGDAGESLALAHRVHHADHVRLSHLVLKDVTTLRASCQITSGNQKMSKMSKNGWEDGRRRSQWAFLYPLKKHKVGFFAYSSSQ